MKRLIVIGWFALVMLACHRAETNWLPSERWPANPVTREIYGEWKCEDALGGFNQPTRTWKPRLDKDNYYRCYVKDAPR